MNTRTDPTKGERGGRALRKDPFRGGAKVGRTDRRSARKLTGQTNGRKQNCGAFMCIVQLGELRSVISGICYLCSIYGISRVFIMLVVFVIFLVEYFCVFFVCFCRGWGSVYNCAHTCVISL